MNKEVKQYIKESIEILNAYPFLVILLAFTGIYIFHGIFTRFSLFNLAIHIIILPIILGRFVEISKGIKLTTPFNIAKKHWFNFYIVTLLFSIPLMIISLMSQKHSSMLDRILFIYVQSIVAILLIYVTPLIFLLRKNISTIPIGIKYLSNNLKRSIPLILLILITTIIVPLLFEYIPYTDTDEYINPPLSIVFL
jgi:hypothetical protein